MDILKFKIDTIDNHSRNWVQTDPVSDDFGLSAILSKSMTIHIDLAVGITGWIDHSFKEKHEVIVESLEILAGRTVVKIHMNCYFQIYIYLT